MEIHQRLADAGSSYDSLPGRFVTINQVVAWNLAFWRKAADLTQEELGERLDWSKVVVSAAERSWDGVRVRQFSADDLVNIADALGLPVAALLLPPTDDGNEVRYLFHLRERGDQTHVMYNLLTLVVSEPPQPSEDDDPVDVLYRERYVAAHNFYLADMQADVVRYLEDLTTEERIVEYLATLRRQYDALRELLADNDKMQDALGNKLGELRTRTRSSAPSRPEQAAQDR
ncbi:MAG: helix-turn-helix domain-containing protein [Streptosporangiaceae bacterium]